jgi:hypothetical protein
LYLDFGRKTGKFLSRGFSDLSWLAAVAPGFSIDAVSCKGYPEIGFRVYTAVYSHLRNKASVPRAFFSSREQVLQWSWASGFSLYLENLCIYTSLARRSTRAGQGLPAPFVPPALVGVFDEWEPLGPLGMWE